MGLLQLFKHEKKKETTEIPVAQLTQWLQTKVKEIAEKHNSEIVSYAQQWKEKEKIIDQLRLELQKKLDLSSQKETQRLQGQNLLAELRQVKDLLVSLQQATEWERILKLHLTLEEKLLSLQELNLEESLLREWSTLHEQFENKLNEIHLLSLLKLKEHDVSLQESISLVASNQRQLDFKEERKKVIIQKQEEKQLWLEELKKDTAYSSVRALKKKQNVLEEQVEKIELDVQTLFSKLNSLLKEYIPQENNSETLSLLRKYQQEPFQAFQNDEHLVILSLLEYMKTLLLEEKLSPDMKQRALFLKHVEKAMNSLPLLQQELLSLLKQLKEAEHSLAVTPLLLKVQDVQYRLDHFTRQALSLEEEIKTIKLELAKLEKKKNSEKKKIEETLQSTLSRDVILV